jgi:hypothetical protein
MNLTEIGLSGMEGSCEHGNEPSGSIKSCGNSLVVERMVTFQEGHVSMELVTYLARPLNLRGEEITPWCP